MEHITYHYNVTFTAGDGTVVTTPIQVSGPVTQEEAEINAILTARKMAKVYRVKDISTIKVVYEKSE